ncbi:MAG: family 20 glycosylhydrolase [Thermoplasmata archaeon]|uniref:Family 20 glycosylhydrolase n=1 Tax=Candidatus Sysuiplasma superficiale TaxID=2823368 RepID=A0A8J7YVN0_9ARCH|nr:family 20 glycosylhydrolase [Candidatus Sysuiplasma superficiale]
MEGKRGERPVIVPEPASLSFDGRWLKFDGLSYGTERIFREFGIRKGRWKLRKEERGGQGVSVEEGVIRYWGKKEIAFATIIQLILQGHGYLPEVSVEERMDFEFRCFHLDIARGGVPTVDTAMGMIRWLFLLKYTHFSIYFEDLFPWRNYREIGNGRGRMKEGEFRRIFNYGRLMGIDVFPSLELLGHMEHILTLEKYSGLSELWWRGDDCLDLTNPEAKKLALGLLEDALSLSESKYVLVGGDETWSLGRGRSLDRLGQYRGPELYIEHYKSIIELVKRHGKEPILWGDMLTGMYLNPEGRMRWAEVVKSDLWNDVFIAHWDYSDGDKDHFSGKIDSIGHKDRQFACPGLSNWLTFYPDFDVALKNMENFFSAAKSSGLRGFIITAWGDGGSECLFSFLQPLLVAGSCLSEGGDWKEAWMALSGESKEILEARILLGEHSLSKRVRKIIQNPPGMLPHENGELAEWKRVRGKIARIELPEDLNFARLSLNLAIKVAEGRASENDFKEFSSKFEKLWLSERKAENLDRVVGNIWSSAGKCGLQNKLRRE